MNESLKFLDRFLKRGKAARLADGFGISGKTTCKIIDFDEDTGIEGLLHRGRKPCRHANQLPSKIMIDDTLVSA